MDKSFFIVSLKDLFCENNKSEKRYSKVWLTEEDFGGLYRSGQYVVNVKAEHLLENCNDEIRHVVKLIVEKLGEDAYKLIRRIAIYNENEHEPHCYGDDIILFSEDVSCEAKK